MASATASIRYRFGRFDLQPDERRLLADGAAVHLGPHALDLLVALVERAGRLVTKHELLTRVWAGVVVEENSLQAQISALRKILGVEAIATVTGQGYRFALSVSQFTEPAAAQTPPPTFLPQPLTSFIGREREIVEIRQCLASTRLLTLTGAGGCGKSRLALQVAGALLEEDAGSVRLVELAPLSDPTLVAQTVAQALAIAIPPDRDVMETMLEWLAPRRMVLVLDNAEHVLEACARLVDPLLRRSPNLAILTTSRERLRIDGELTYRVPSLSVPTGDGLEGLLACESVRLFIDRARLQRQDFAPTGKDVTALASICRRLDGIALAIELAAPQVRIMSLEELDARLDSRFALLTAGSRTGLPRHRTLRSLLDWSHDLLSEPERFVLRRASVFAGGWTLDAAERVCTGPGIDRGEVLHLLGSLESKSLVVAEVEGETARFRMLETVREYARLRLQESGDSGAVYGSLAHHLADLAADLDAPHDPALQRALRQLDAEHDNVRAVLAWCESDPARARTGLRLAALLVEFWRMRGLHGEGLAWLRRLQAPPAMVEPDETQALALHASGTLLGVDSDQTAAAAFLRSAVDLWRRLARPLQVARSLLCLTEVEWYGGRAESARAACAEALAISRELGDQRSVVNALCYGSEMARVAGDYEEGRRLLDECLPLSRGIGTWASAATLNYLGSIEYARGDHARARSTWLEALPGYRDFGDRQGSCAALMSIAMVSQELGDLPKARSYLREAWNWLPGGDDNEMLYWLDFFAALLVAGDRAADAARIWGCIESHREARGLERPYTKRYRRMLDAGRSALRDAEAFDRAWTEGRSWPLEEAKRLARNFHHESGSGTGSAPSLQ